MIIITILTILTMLIIIIGFTPGETAPGRCGAGARERRSGP